VSIAAEDGIARYGFAPHPEGGDRREVHRSARSLGGPFGYPGDGVVLTAICFLRTRGDFSAFHRVRSEEA